MWTGGSAPEDRHRFACGSGVFYDRMFFDTAPLSFIDVLLRVSEGELSFPSRTIARSVQSCASRQNHQT